MIRRAAEADMPAIMEIYAAARIFMAERGNPRQWGNGYPGEELLRSDIRKGQLFIEEFDGAIHGVFAFVLGEDPTYRKIEDCGWLSDQPYGTIHRVASDGCRSGFLKRITEYCEEITGHIRIDTHEENQTMRRSILRNGFTRCGIIFAADGSPRIAYEKVQ